MGICHFFGTVNNKAVGRRSRSYDEEWGGCFSEWNAKNDTMADSVDTLDAERKGCIFRYI